MKILIVSDTHRREDNLKRILEKQKPIDMFIHLGDAEGSDDLIASWLSPGCQTRMVLGNNDFFSSLEAELEVEIGSHKALLTHGHYYNVSLGVENLRREAKARGCDIAMYGHTHRPYLEECEGVTVLNPGSLSYPRQEGRRPSYMVMEMDETGRIECGIFYME